MCKRVLSLTLTGLALLGSLSAQTKSTDAFNKLLSLEGNWTGTYMWNNHPDKSGKMEAHYYTTGNKSALVENLIQSGAPAMTSVYQMDGDDLQMTHFCAAQNQPRLKVTAISADGSQITFAFVDVTNLSSPKAGHVEGLDVRVLSVGHITLAFHFIGGGKSSEEVVDLKRKS